ncbi:hypothetical protein Q9Q99_01400 [Curtobacterium flaccumfaciens]|nr:hypothetical protein Q9Q99_01400 [Curtobacterium flaccumfaciens]
MKLLRPAPDQAIPLRDVAVVLDAAGAPTVQLSGAAAALAESIGCGPIAILAGARTGACGGDGGGPVRVVTRGS